MNGRRILIQNLRKRVLKTPFMVFSTNQKEVIKQGKWNIRQFGKTGVKVFVIMAICVFSTIYYLVSREYIKKTWIITKLNHYGYNPQKYIDKIGEKYVDVAIAYALHYATNPIRLVLSCIIAGYITKPKTANKSSGMKLKLLGLYSSFWLGGAFLIYFLVKSNRLDLEKILQLDSTKSGNLNEYYKSICTTVNNKELAQTLIINTGLEVVRLPICWIIYKFLMKKK